MHDDFPDNPRRRTIPGLILVFAAAVAWGGALSAQGDQSPAGPAADAQAAAAPQSGAQTSQGGRTPGGRGSTGTRSTPPGMRPEWEWWKDAEYLKLSNLAPQQAKHINDIYENRLRRMRPFAEEMVRESAVLNRMARERVASDEEFQLQAQRVSSLQGRLWESRQVMLYSLYKQLTAEQYQKLLEVREARERRRMGRGHSPQR